ncbi:MAG: ParA family protein [Spirochaetia bacterium]|nr:ParA family protein [Spirochaetia bacterium]
MIQSIAIANQKGGVGKSTTTLAMGEGYLKRGYKVLFIDMDAQGNLSYTLGRDGSRHSILDVLRGEIGADKAIQHTYSGDLIASSPALSGADMELNRTGKEYMLREALACIKDKYDYIILDTPPSLGILTVQALTACTWAIIPAQADIYSLQGIGQLYGTIDAVRTYCNPSLVIRGILLTRHTRTILSRDILQMIDETATQLGTVLFDTTIRENVALREAQASRRDIFDYAPRSKAAQDYRDLITELLEDEEE